MPLKPDADYSKTKTYNFSEAEHRNITTAEILIAARNLISKTENWTQDVMARDMLGEEVSQFDPDAVCFCAVGALAAAKRNLRITEQEIPINKVVDYLKTFITGSVMSFNDCSPHAKVLELFDQAITNFNVAN